MKTVFKQYLTALLTVFSVTLTAAAPDIASVSSQQAVIPVYHDNRLQLVLFGEELQPQGNLVVANGAVIELIRKDAKIADVILKPSLPYELNADLTAVFEFWRKHLSFSDGILFTPQAALERDSKLLHGSREVKFRSAALDLDGVGFTANYELRTVEILDEVKIVIRSGKSDLRNSLAQGIAPDASGLIHASAKQMSFDLTQRQIVLRNNVVIEQGDQLVKCDQVTIFLRPEQTAAATQNATDFAKLDASEIDHIVCEGHLQIIGQETGNAALTLYQHQDNAPTANAAANQIPLLPGVTLSADSSDFNYNLGILKFKGNVRITGRESTLVCREATVYLTSGVKLNNAMLKKIVCSGSIIASQLGRRISCDNFEASFIPRQSGRTTPNAADLIDTGKVELATAKITGNLRLDYMDNRAENPRNATVTANQAELDFQKNLASFSGAVRAAGADCSLESEQVDFTIVPLLSGTADLTLPRDQAPTVIALGKNLELQTVVASGEVVFSRYVANNLQQAFGERAVYVVRNQDIIMTGTPTAPPRLSDGPQQITSMPGSRIRIDLSNENIEMENARYISPVQKPAAQ